MSTRFKILIAEKKAAKVIAFFRTYNKKITGPIFFVSN